MITATAAWTATLAKILGGGREISPRGCLTRELDHHLFACDMSASVVRAPARKLSYKFLAAEALWIINGDDTVAGIAPYNARIVNFSDDGLTFFGAYGPRVVAQLDYVIEALVRDRDTRQAVLTTWRPCPPLTKDVPCTVALAFSIRDDQLNCHAFMRSSDAWLGLPYDAFNFSMVAAKVACRYNAALATAPAITLGRLYLTSASSHLYEENFSAAVSCIEFRARAAADDHDSDRLQTLVFTGDWQSIEDSLIACRDDHASQWAQAWVIRPPKESA